MRLALASIATLIAAPFMSATAQSDIETPAYRLISEAGPMQLRDYAPMIAAEVTVKADNKREAASRGFRPLAGYIFGGNTARDKIAMTAPVTSQASQKIEMTAPVTTTPSSEGEYTVRFIMPREWTMETLPVPNNNRVTLIEVPQHQMAAIRYVGKDSSKIRSEAEAELTKWLAGEGYRITGDAVWAGYDGPMTRRSERRYEIMLPVKKAEDAA
ncbi:MAG: heme-binding protein [Pseudomonadota bacterium]